MTETPRPEETEKVACEVCLKEVPRSEAKSAEAQDYVLHFCGVDCYDRWSKEEDTGEAGDES